MSAPDRVVLVDLEDRQVGEAEKLDAHRRGALHRAFSVFVVDGANRLLLQRRAPGKYHSGGLWSNTCCGHPRPGESVVAAARRRLAEEMGLDCPLERAGAFVYRARVGELIEYEYDHVLVGRCDGLPRPNPAEVAEWRWVSQAELEQELETHPERYTVWVGRALQQLHRIRSPS